MVSVLLLKMLRDIRRSAAPYLIGIGIVAVGFCGYSVLSIATDQLAASRDHFFEVTAFPDAFAEVQEAPLEAARRLGQIEGVAAAQGRLTATARVPSHGNAELLLVSTWQSGMDLPLLYKGDLPDENARELVVGDGFFKAHGLEPGDAIEVAFAGRPVAMTVTGSGFTPENIYMVKNLADMLPDPANYDAAFLHYGTMSQLLGKQGRANGFLLTLEPGVVIDDVREEIERLLEPYGCYSVYAQEDQFSVSMLQMEIDQVGEMAGVMPFLFLFVAAVILYITLSRLIEQQRVQAGALMALGLSPLSVRLHYTGYGALVGVVGGALGGLLGNAAAGPMVDYYRVYFNLPEVATDVSSEYLLLGTAMAAVFCSWIGWICASALGRLMPAESLRPPSPKAARMSLLERIPGFLSLFTVPGVMAVRSLSRNRRRTALSLLGIACAYMVTATLVSMNTLFDVYIFDILEKNQQQDITVSFTEPVAISDARRAVRDPAIEVLEGVVDLSVTLRGQNGELDCAVQGVEPNAQLSFLFDEGGNAVQVGRDGIVLSQYMAKKLGVTIGDLVEAEVSYPKKRTSRVPVSGIMAQYIGTTAYMSLDALASISDYRGVYTSMLLKAPADVQQKLADRLSDATKVAGVESRQQRIQKYRDMMGSFTGIMFSLAMMGVVTGVAVIYTSSLISFEELKREIATLRVLGLSSRQCLDVLSVSQWILTFGGILLGIPMTMGASRLLSMSMVTDMFTIPDFVDGASLLLSIALTVVSVLFSTRMILRSLRRISPVELLRERE